LVVIATEGHEKTCTPAFFKMILPTLTEIFFLKSILTSKSYRNTCRPRLSDWTLDSLERPLCNFTNLQTLDKPRHLAADVIFSI